MCFGVVSVDGCVVCFAMGLGGLNFQFSRFGLLIRWRLRIGAFLVAPFSEMWMCFRLSLMLSLVNYKGQGSPPVCSYTRVNMCVASVKPVFLCVCMCGFGFKSNHFDDPLLG